MQTISVDSLKRSDLAELARIDGEWDAETILECASVPSTRTMVVRIGGNLAGYLIMHFGSYRLVIWRMCAEHDDAAHGLLATAKDAVTVANRKRRARQEMELSGISTVLDLDDSNSNDVLRASGFRAADICRTDDSVRMTWKRGN